MDSGFIIERVSYRERLLKNRYLNELRKLSITNVQRQLFDITIKLKMISNINHKSLKFIMTESKVSVFTTPDIYSVKRI